MNLNGPRMDTIESRTNTQVNHRTHPRLDRPTDSFRIDEKDGCRNSAPELDKRTQDSRAVAGRTRSGTVGRLGDNHRALDAHRLAQSLPDRCEPYVKRPSSIPELLRQFVDNTLTGSRIDMRHCDDTAAHLRYIEPRLHSEDRYGHRGT